MPGDQGLGLGGGGRLGWTALTSSVPEILPIQKNPKEASQAFGRGAGALAGGTGLEKLPSGDIVTCTHTRLLF